MASNYRRSVGVLNPNYGCQHYKRMCSFYAPCCRKIYVCRLCHDDAENHKLDRTKVEVLQCNNCETLQAVKKQCSYCDVVFGKYYCEICRMFEDRTEKDLFHCDQCGICRLGGVNNFVHCSVCNACIHISILEGGQHKCVENATRKECIICNKEMFSCTEPLKLGRCGHCLHKACAQRLRNSGTTKCQYCREEFF